MSKYLSINNTNFFLKGERGGWNHMKILSSPLIEFRNLIFAYFQFWELLSRKNENPFKKLFFFFFIKKMINFFYDENYRIFFFEFRY